MTDFPAKLGKWIATTREEKHVSQQLLADQLGTDQPTISRIESGHRGVSVEEFLKIGEALAVSDEELFAVISRLRDSAAGYGSIWDRQFSE